nr:hypothetical protein JVH1_0028 [Rhodococcus sp. JVH1]
MPFLLRELVKLRKVGQLHAAEGSHSVLHVACPDPFDAPAGHISEQDRPTNRSAPVSTETPSASSIVAGRSSSSRDRLLGGLG